MATKTAHVTQVGKNSITFAGHTDSKHWLMMDGPTSFGGNDAGIRPKELLLLSLAGCTGSDVASILSKKRVTLDGFEMIVTAEETEEHPKVFSSMHVEYVFRGKGIEAKDVERAIELSQTRYCGVTAMLEKAMDITHSYRIVEVE
ncbi:MAG: OsmC family protein [Bacteroidia bacterium]|nr:OsmC family protein [Bacteroidia bacterium]